MPFAVNPDAVPYVIHPDVARARSQLGVAVRRGRGNAAIADARRDLAAAKLAHYIERVVAESPPFTPDQRARLAALLRGGASA